ncbi:alpha/beta-hydrolase, partial [Agrocybe pediades]
PFKIDVPQESIDLLQQKLSLTTFPDELEDANWDYGTPLADVKRLVSRWRNGYDWRKHEAALNKELPQFRRDIEVEEHGR